jgi:hypothetical protein
MGRQDWAGQELLQVIQITGFTRWTLKSACRGSACRLRARNRSKRRAVCCGGRGPAEAAGHFPTTNARHADVAEHDVRAWTRCQLDPLRPS